MKLKDNKGITGIDISVALIIIVLFVGLVSSLSYNYVIASRNVNRKGTATDIAIAKLEELKRMTYDDILEMSGQDQNATEYYNVDGQKLEGGTGPYKLVTEVRKYTNSNIENIQDVLKIAKVTVTYSIGNREESVEISTAITRED